MRNSGKIIGLAEKWKISKKIDYAVIKFEDHRSEFQRITYLVTSFHADQSEGFFDQTIMDVSHE